MNNMKSTFTVIVSILIASSFSYGQKFDHYGEKLSDAKPQSANEFLSKMKNVDSAKVKIKAEINETCRMKGCWMTLDLGNDQEMRVTFKDYGFFVPKKGVDGRKAIVEGIAKKSTTDVATLQHYAKDAGKSEEEIAAITEPKDEITFVATGVAIEE